MSEISISHLLPFLRVWRLHCPYGARAIQASGPRCKSFLVFELKTRVLTIYLDIAHLEHKVEDLEARVRKLSIGAAADSKTQDIEPEDQADSWHSLEQVDSALSIASSKHGSFDGTHDPGSDYFSRHPADALGLDLKNEALGSMSDYRGRTTGVEVLRSLRHLCDNFVGFSVDPDHPATRIVSALDYDAPFEKLPIVSFAGSFYSPANMIRRWIDLAFDEAFVLWHFIDRESVVSNIQRLIESGTTDRDGHGRDYIGLLHSIVALGQRHDSTLISLEGRRSHSEETRG